MKLHIFNPETDYALEQGRKPYTPPKSIVALRRRLALLPLVFTDADDMVLVDNKSDYPDDEKVVDWNGLKLIAPEIEGVEPWGWNHNLRRELVAHGVATDLLPTEESLDVWRMLSHRRQTIAFNMNLQHTASPRELFSISDAEKWLCRHPDSFFKAPWSSAGRGILRVTPNTKWESWFEGIKRRQGSVVAEISIDKTLDFATEWHYADGKAEFAGYSVFDADGKGNYTRNASLSQNELKTIISQALKSPEMLLETVDIQKSRIEDMLHGSGYAGYLGIDMMADGDGYIVPCVEINLRKTMGLVEIFRERRNRSY